MQPLNLPDLANALKVSKSGSLQCVIRACHFFQERKYGFTPHDLRHAYNHRGHHLNYNPAAF
ncbi:hypothetical protein IQ238_29980 [Pleurocapsales cyanobacterium LEGE 06147]|nr:hypothetical protein [Pleurocapsales cyanobacterium LEGE 06147]